MEDEEHARAKASSDTAERGKKKTRDDKKKAKKSKDEKKRKKQRDLTPVPDAGFLAEWNDNSGREGTPPVGEDAFGCAEREATMADMHERATKNKARERELRDRERERPKKKRHTEKEKTSTVKKERKSEKAADEDGGKELEPETRRTSGRRLRHHRSSRTNAEDDATVLVDGQTEAGGVVLVDGSDKKPSDEPNTKTNTGEMTEIQRLGLAIAWAPRFPPDCNPNQVPINHQARPHTQDHINSGTVPDFQAERAARAAAMQNNISNVPILTHHAMGMPTIFAPNVRGYVNPPRVMLQSRRMVHTPHGVIQIQQPMPAMPLMPVTGKSTDPTPSIPLPDTTPTRGTEMIEEVVARTTQEVLRQLSGHKSGDTAELIKKISLQVVNGHKSAAHNKDKGNDAPLPPPPRPVTPPPSMLATPEVRRQREGTPERGFVAKQHTSNSYNRQVPHTSSSGLRKLPHNLAANNKNNNVEPPMPDLPVPDIPKKHTVEEKDIAIPNDTLLGIHDDKDFQSLDVAGGSTTTQSKTPECDVFGDLTDMSFLLSDPPPKKKEEDDTAELEKQLLTELKNTPKSTGDEMYQPGTKNGVNSNEQANKPTSKSALDMLLEQFSGKKFSNGEVAALPADSKTKGKKEENSPSKGKQGLTIGAFQFQSAQIQTVLEQEKERKRLERQKKREKKEKKRQRKEKDGKREDKESKLQKTSNSTPQPTTTEEDETAMLASLDDDKLLQMLDEELGDAGIESDSEMYHPDSTPMLLQSPPPTHSHTIHTNDGGGAGSGGIAAGGGGNELGSLVGLKLQQRLKAIAVTSTTNNPPHLLSANPNPFILPQHPMGMPPVPPTLLPGPGGPLSLPHGPPGGPPPLPPHHQHQHQGLAPPHPQFHPVGMPPPPQPPQPPLPRPSNLLVPTNHLIPPPVSVSHIVPPVPRGPPLPPSELTRPGPPPTAGPVGGGSGNRGGGPLPPHLHQLPMHHQHQHHSHHHHHHLSSVGGAVPPPSSSLPSGGMPPPHGPPPTPPPLLDTPPAQQQPHHAHHHHRGPPPPELPPASPRGGGSFPPTHQIHHHTPPPAHNEQHRNNHSQHQQQRRDSNHHHHHDNRQHQHHQQHQDRQHHHQQHHHQHHHPHDHHQHQHQHHRQHPVGRGHPSQGFRGPHGGRGRGNPGGR